MNYLALYRKYRPKELDEVVGQNDVKKILANSVKNGTITHAYLFSGPRGTGKTTMAKILAKMVNCEHPVDGNACNECNSCLNVLNSNDVIEIDAASNNGVDEIRDLREKANLVPSAAKYKVYIIDEVHMLTTQAFNALLKTLEEPPHHVIFILATTEYYKIPMTITSRCQKFQFTKISDGLIVDRLREISNLENIDISDEALKEIAKISDGGMRDSINFLDQLRSFNNNKIEIDDVYDVCGNVSIYEIVSLFTDMRNNDYEKVISFFDTMNSSGKNYGKFLEDIISFLKDVIIYSNNVSDRYIKSNIECIQNISKIYSDSEIYFIIEYINKIFDSLKNVSKQSIIIVSNFLLLMNKLNNSLTTSVDTGNVNASKSESNENYEMAFSFTNKEESVEVDSIVDEAKTEVIEDNLNESVDVNKDIIVNNAFALADKKVKTDLQNRLSLLNDYLTDKKYKVAASSLIDVNLEVASDNYLIFSSKTSANVAKVYSNFKLCSELLNIIFNKEYFYAVVTDEEWSSLRDEYIKNTKNGVKYVVKDIVKQIEIVESEEKQPTIVDKLFDLVGEENVEFK